MEEHGEFGLNKQATYLRYTNFIPLVIEKETGNGGNKKNPETMKLLKTLRT